MMKLLIASALAMSVFAEFKHPVDSAAAQRTLLQPEEEEVAPAAAGQGKKTGGRGAPQEGATGSGSGYAPPGGR